MSNKNPLNLTDIIEELCSNQDRRISTEEETGLLEFNRVSLTVSEAAMTALLLKWTEADREIYYQDPKDDSWAPKRIMNRSNTKLGLRDGIVRAMRSTQLLEVGKKGGIAIQRHWAFTPTEYPSELHPWVLPRRRDGGIGGEWISDSNVVWVNQQELKGMESLLAQARA